MLFIYTKQIYKIENIYISDYWYYPANNNYRSWRKKTLLISNRYTRTHHNIVPLLLLLKETNRYINTKGILLQYNYLRGDLLVTEGGRISQLHSYELNNRVDLACYNSLYNTCWCWSSHMESLS